MIEWAQLALLPCPYCSACPTRHLCHERGTARGCLPGGAPHPHLLHPTKPDWLARFAELNGFDLHNVQAVDQDIPLLPRYIPHTRLNADVKGYRGLAGMALSLCEVQRLAARVRKHNTSAKAVLGLSEDQLLVILGFERDSFLEEAWPPPRLQQVLAAIQDVRPDLAIAWGFSVWYRHAEGWVYPRVEQLYSIKRSLVVYESLQRWGIPAIPHVYWGNHADLDRWGRWLAENPCVSTIAIDLQTADSISDWRIVLRGVTQLRGALRRDVRVLFNGPCALPRIRELDTIWPGCSFSNFGAYFSALFRFKQGYGLDASWAGNSLLPSQAIFRSAVSEYVTFLADPARCVRTKVRWDGWNGSRKPSPAVAGGLALPIQAYPRTGAAQLALPVADAEMQRTRPGAA